jgi:hypothetical protein
MQAPAGYSEFVVSRLASPSNVQVILGLSVIYLCEFVKVHLGPVLFGGVRAVVSVLLPKQWMANSNVPSKRQPSVEEIMAEEATLMEKERHKTSSEDKKSSKGSDNDFYMLRTHGYNKYRFVSPSFIQRNKLKSSED